MSDTLADLLADLDALVKVWRGYIEANESGNGPRAEGYLNGLRICAEQLAESAARTRVRQADDE